MGLMFAHYNRNRAALVACKQNSNRPWNGITYIPQKRISVLELCSFSSPCTPLLITRKRTGSPSLLTSDPFLDINSMR